MARIRVAHEILARLIESDGDSVRELLRARAESLGVSLTGAELAVMSRFIGGESPQSIGQGRGLTEKTISNQIRSGYQKLGFTDRRELKGWGMAVTGYILTEPTEE